MSTGKCTRRGKYGKTAGVRRVVSDIHTYLVLTFAVIACLQFNLFGKVGLFVYGLLVAYGMLFFVLNIRIRRLCATLGLYIAIAYYCYFILAECINGKWTRGGASLLQLLALTLVMSFSRSKDEQEYDIRTIAKILTVAGIAMCTGSLLISLVAFHFPGLVDDLPSSVGSYMRMVRGAFPSRMTGMAGNANVTGGFCLVCLMFSTYLLSVDRRTAWKWLSAADIIIALFTIFLLNASRTSMLSAMVFLMTFFFNYFLSLRKWEMEMMRIFRIILIAGGGLAIVMLLLFLTCSPFHDFILDHMIRESSLRTGSGRTDVYTAVIELAKDNPIFGFSHIELAKNNAPGTTSAHNVFLHALAFSGIPGLVLFTTWILYTMVVAIRNFSIYKKDSVGKGAICCFFMCFLFAYLAYGMTEDCSLDGMKMISVCTQMVMAYTHQLAGGKWRRA